MTYQIARDGALLGTFDEEQIPDALFDGTLLLTDLVWCEGMTAWEPISEIVDVEEIQPEAKAEAASPRPVRQRPSVLPAPLPPPRLTLPTIDGHTSGLAITSLVLGILSVCGSYLTGLPAIIFGIIAIVSINKSAGAYTGRGLAIGGIVSGAVLGLFGTAVVIALAMPFFSHMQEKAWEMQACSNARQIVIALKAYAADNNGLYPDADPRVSPSSSNQIFRELIKRGFLEDERCFASPSSDAHPDNDMGSAPDFSEALQAGENAWAMCVGLSDAATGDAPLVFEAPIDAIWPPTWNANVTGIKVPGGVGRSGKVIIARNDGSVAGEELSAAQGQRLPLKARSDGTALFDLVPSKTILLPER